MFWLFVFVLLNFPFLPLCDATAGGAGFAASFSGVGELIYSPSLKLSNESTGISIEFWMIVSVASSSFTPFSLYCPSDNLKYDITKQSYENIIASSNSQCDRFSWSGLDEIVFLNNLIQIPNRIFFPFLDTDFASWYILNLET
jgi:hypothetical protein